jgi:hypothetical protein
MMPVRASQGPAGEEAWLVRQDGLALPSYCGTTVFGPTISTAAGSVMIPFLWHPKEVKKKYHLVKVELSFASGSAGTLGFFIQPAAALPAVNTAGLIQPLNSDNPKSNASFVHVTVKPTGITPLFGGRYFTNSETNNYYEWNCMNYPRGTTPELRPNRDEGIWFWLEVMTTLTTAPQIMFMATWVEE